MRTFVTLYFLIVATGICVAQDLELDVHLLPPAQLGDPAAFNIKVQNTGEENVEGIAVKVTLLPGIKFKSFVRNDAPYDPETGLWNIGSLYKKQAVTITVIATYEAKEDALLQAEIISSSLPDPDSEPGNGVDTNGNGKIANDPGDEDDGDAAAIIR